MKTLATIKAVCEARGISEKLARSVLRQLGGGEAARDSLRDVARGGADAGFCGFTYYSDTVDFFRRNRAEVVALVERMASDLGEGVVDMVAGFQCLGGRDMKREHCGALDGRAAAHNRAVVAEFTPSVSRCLYGGRLTDEDTEVANALAWFALEEVARAFDDYENE
jgi:hypothetical protein